VRIPGEEDLSREAADSFSDPGNDGDSFGRAERAVNEIVLHIDNDQNILHNLPP